MEPTQAPCSCISHFLGEAGSDEGPVINLDEAFRLFPFKQQYCDGLSLLFLQHVLSSRLPRALLCRRIILSNQLFPIFCLCSCLFFPKTLTCGY